MGYFPISERRVREIVLVYDDKVPLDELVDNIQWWEAKAGQYRSALTLISKLGGEGAFLARTALRHGELFGNTSQEEMGKKDVG